MGYIALYRKYRPTRFSDVVGQDTTIKILKNSISENKIGHAYIFSGPRGTGKTSIAKIFARAVNCLNPIDGDLCDECENCKNLVQNDSDIIEMDAASNNGVDEIREIRNNTKLMPNIGKYKIYIIDEVHMLSTGAFNALLKTLEEPPSHVIFILATTEIQKIPLTILSRCQKFDFHKVNDEVMKKRLKFILNEENRTLEDNILNLIVKLSDGCVRDAVNLLDQVLTLEGDINEESIYVLSGDISDEKLISFINNIVNCDYDSGLLFINDFFNEGKNLNILVNKMLILLRNISISRYNSKLFSENQVELYNSLNINDQQVLTLTKILLELNNELRKSTMQKILLEIYFLQMCNVFNKNDEIITDKISTDVKEESSVIESKENNEKENMISDDIKSIRIGNVLSKADKKVLLDVQNKFLDIEEYSSNKTFNNAYSILSEAKIVVASDEYLLLSFDYPSTLLLFNKNINEVEELMKKLLGIKYKLVAITSEEWVKLKNEYVKNRDKFTYKKEDVSDIVEQKEEHDEIDTVFDLFGEDTVSIK